MKRFCSNGNELTTSGKPPGHFLSGLPDKEIQRVDLNVGIVLGDRFRIGKQLGAGRRSVVYLAEDFVHGTEVALKVIDVGHVFSAGLIQRLQYEAALHSRIGDYRHVLRMHDSFITQWEGTKLWLVSMECADGGTLRKWLMQNRNDWERRHTEGAKFFEQICLGVAALHDADILHLDLKPENILFVDGVPKVADFSCAVCTVTDGSTAAAPAFALSSDSGTGRYMSQEQCSAECAEDLEQTCDIYSLGVMQYEIHHPQAQTPFTGSRKRLRELHMTREAPTLAEAGERVAHIIARCLQKNPADRYQTVHEILHDLRGDGFVNSVDAEKLWKDACLVFAEGKFQEARDICEQTSASGLEHSGAREMLQEIRSRFDQAERIYRSVEEDLDCEDLHDLAVRLKEAVAVYPEHPLGRAAQSRLASRARRYRENMETAAQTLMRGDWGSGLIHLRNAAQLNRGDVQLPVLIARVSEINEVCHGMRERIDEAVASGDSDEALSLARLLDQRIERINCSFRFDRLEEDG